jgi:signal transduction histidine kinase/ActR/RegA family two-component response regulator
VILWALISFSFFSLSLHAISRIETQAEDNALARAEIGTQTIEKIIGQILELSDVYQNMAQTAFNLAEAGDHIGAATIYNHLAGVARAEHFGIFYIAIFDSSGNTYWSSFPELYHSYIFESVKSYENLYSDGAIRIQGDMEGERYGRPSVQFSRRFQDPTGRVAGTVFVLFDTAPLSQALRTVQFGPGAAALIKLRDGTILAHSHSAGTTPVASLAAGSILARALERAPSGRIRVHRSPFDGQPKLAAYRSLSQAPIVVCVALDPRSELAPISFARPLLLATATAISLLALAAIALAMLWLDRRRAQSALDAARRDREAAWEQLFHTQRTEALGRLAGGVAHDFNNVLQAVLGGAKSIKRRSADAGIQRLAGMVVDAAERGASVTRRLLTLARRGELRTEPVQLTDVLAGLHEVLTHTLGAEIEVRIKAAHPLPPILTDKWQLETVLVNLSVNARDAMAPRGGGTLTLSAREESILSNAAPEHGPKPGTYIRISVQDTGLGMDTATLARATEPFFTTKSDSKGTGLGLAMAKGFVEQSGGALRITSERGLGTMVTLWLPCAGTGAQRPPPARTEPAQDNETTPAHVRGLRVLLVDDEVLVRDALADDLAALGWTVVTAGTGAEALSHLDQPETLDLLVTDLAMPGMNGLALIRAARERRPRLPALLLTGHAGDAHAELLDLAEANGPFAMLRKPAHAEAMWASCETLVSQRDVAG